MKAPGLNLNGFKLSKTRQKCQNPQSQADKYRFNRASLINVGYIYTEKLGFDYFAMHDVDLIPTTHQIKER